MGLSCYSIICSNHHHDNISSNSSMCPHGLESCMPWGVQDRNGIIFLVRTHCQLKCRKRLGNSTCLAASHISPYGFGLLGYPRPLAQSVHEGGLSMVHVSHNAHHGGAGGARARHGLRGASGRERPTFDRAGARTDGIEAEFQADELRHVHIVDDGFSICRICVFAKLVQNREEGGWFYAKKIVSKRTDGNGIVKGKSDCFTF
mmetsp:Transcript_33359/g.76994  ORF Transcript_33359/g.76994 Transcript_33359/m.76994 type:complete len:203 (-) Transcript_33359:546-1154(-)